MCALLGEVRLFPYGNIHAGWLACAGQTLYISEYPRLYMLIGTIHVAQFIISLLLEM